MEQQIQERRNWTINGTARSMGGNFDKVTIRGEAKVTGDLDCYLLKLMGTLSVHGDLKMKTSKIMGTVDVTGNVSGEKLSLLGELNVKGDCNAEWFKSRGAFHIDGLLNAGNIEVSLYGPCRAREIGGDLIHVKPHFKLFASGIRQLTVDTVEGDDICLQYTTARVVRGNRVEIGHGCDIELVEYKTDFRQDAGAKIGQQVKL